MEKNPNALITLQAIMAGSERWQAEVTLVHADMRFWEAPEPADIMVSVIMISSRNLNTP